jgi:hypothetical protein
MSSVSGLIIVRFHKDKHQSLDSDGQILPRDYIGIQVRSSSRASPTLCVNESDDLGSAKRASGCVHIAMAISMRHPMLKYKNIVRVVRNTYGL